MSVVATNTPYQNKEKVFVGPTKVWVMTTLNGGDADFYITDEDQTAWHLVTALTDTPEFIEVPGNGWWKVIHSGGAVVYSEE